MFAVKVDPRIQHRARRYGGTIGIIIVLSEPDVAVLEIEFEHEPRPQELERNDVVYFALEFFGGIRIDEPATRAASYGVQPHDRNKDLHLIHDSPACS